MTLLTIDAAAGADGAPADGEGIGVGIKEQLGETEIKVHTASPGLEDDIAVMIRAEDGTHLELVFGEEEAASLANGIKDAIANRVGSVEA